MPEGANATLEALTHEQCMQLLVRHDVGRLAVTIPDHGPLVVPVNYTMDGEVVVFRSDPGTKIAALRIGPVSFEVDEIDHVNRTGWSVLIDGAAYEATHWETDHLQLTPWTAGSKAHWIRIVPATITGRRIALPPFEPNQHLYM